MYSTTGVTQDQFVAICRDIRELLAGDAKTPWPPILGLSGSVRVTLTYLRRNRTQSDLAETHGVSQPTISRAVAALTPLIGVVLAGWVPVAEDLHTDLACVVDGTLLPCWSWANRPELYSGKHHTTGVNVQVAATLAGTVAWVSDPLPGSTHDITALRASAVLDGLDPSTWIADRGYQGTTMITPVKKSPGADLSDDRKNFNTAVNRIRYVIERAIAHLKTWRILHTDYRRPFTTFQQTITTVIALHFYTLAP
jgi:DDE superfamily endonuclease/Helix-turn-helix of DDE superfamily endonuclease